MEAYEKWVKHPDRAILYYQIREKLAGKDLVCYCKPKACHADILLEIANSYDAEGNTISIE